MSYRMTQRNKWGDCIDTGSWSEKRRLVMPSCLDAKTQRIFRWRSAGAAGVLARVPADRFPSVGVARARGPCCRSGN